MYNVIAGANSFVHVIAWGFDDEMQWSVDGQRPLKVYSRRNPSPPAGARSSDDERCDQPIRSSLPAIPVKTKPSRPSFSAFLGDDSLIPLLRCKAADLAVAAEAKTRPNSFTWELAYGEVMVLVWDQTLDVDNYAPPLTNLDDVAYVLVSSADVLTWNKQRLHDEMRARGSGESMRVLEDFQNYYKDLVIKGHSKLPAKVIMPTGIMIMTQRNQNKNLAGVVQEASHHQKLIIGDESAFVGGLNTFKEYWDTQDHDLGDFRRWTSSNLSDYTKIPDPNANPPPALHDTGAIVRGTPLVSRINDTFSSRWASNLSNYQGVADLPFPLTILTGNAIVSSPYLALQWRLADQLVTQIGTHVPTGGTLKLLLELRQLEQRRKQPQTAVASMADSAFTASNVDFKVSHPTNSYASSEGEHEIRDTYEALARNTLNSPGTFAYFENQYVQDFELAQILFVACTPKFPSNDHWCPRDPYIHFVVPFEPGGSGIALIDNNLVVPEMVYREMQLFTWLEVKTARVLKERQSGDDLVYIRPPKPAICPCESGTTPDIKFVDPAAQASPDGVTPDSEIEVTGFDAKRPCLPPPLNTNYCFQPLTKRFKVKDVITDGAIMAYALANPFDVSGADRSKPSGSDPIQRYDNFLGGNFIYVHSKHSELFGKTNSGPRLTYAVGSANLNARSLGNTALNQDANDSEDEIFWTPATDKFWRTLWNEHTGIDFSNPNIGAIDAAQRWENQGWKNWKNARDGTSFVKGERVVRLDAFARCQHFHGKVSSGGGAGHPC